MADAKQDKKQEKANPSSEGFGFKQSPLGFDKNEVNLYINKLKKQMKEQQQEYEMRIDNMRKNLEDAHDEQNAAKAAAQPSQPAQIIGNTDADVIKAVNEAKAEAKKESDAKIMELRKQVLDERRNVAKLDKECAMAQMSEKKVREEYAKLKEKYKAAKKAGGGGKAVVTSNADEVLDEALKLAQEVKTAADAYVKASVESVNAYKAKVEAELKARSEKLSAAKKQLDDETAKAKAENENAKKSMKEIADKIAAVTGSLSGFAASFDAVNAQISTVTSSIDAVTGQFGSVSAQINEATESIGNVTKQFGSVSAQINAATESIGGVTKQFDSVSQQITAAAQNIGNVTRQFGTVTDNINKVNETIGGVSKEFEGVSGKLTAAKDSFGSVSEALGKAKTTFGDVTKAVSDTKNGIDGIKTGAEAAAALTSADKAAGGADAETLTSVSAAIEAATAAITAEITLPEFKTSFDSAKLDELKKKLKVETTYEGGEAFDDEDEDEDILSSIEIDDIPEAPVPSDEELMADLPAVEPEPEPVKPAPQPVKAPEAPKKAEKKASLDDDLSDFFITPTTEDSSSLINTTGVGAIDDFTLDAEPEPLGEDFDLAPNDLTAAPDKGMDLGDDIFDMAINPVGADDDTLSNMMAEQKVKDEEGDFMLTPAEIQDEYKAGGTGNKFGDDFGEFADLFAAGSAETSAEAPKKKPAAFRQSSNSDDPFNFGMEGSGDDTDMSADSDLSDLLL